MRLWVVFHWKISVFPQKNWVGLNTFAYLCWTNCCKIIFLGNTEKLKWKLIFLAITISATNNLRFPDQKKNHNADRMGLTINMFPLDNRFILGINVIGLFQSSKMPRANTAWGISKCLEVAIHLNYTCLKLVAKFLNGTSEYNIDYLTVHVT